MSNATETPASHTARCLRPGCGRKLRAASSIAAGYGRVCARKIRAAAIAEAKADFTAKQVAKADELIRDGGIIQQAPGLYVVVSGDGDRTYATDGHSCTCDAGAHDVRCYHLLGARILDIASRKPPVRHSMTKAA